jgi:hypothetical protein
VSFIVDRLRGETEQRRRVLVGFDFPYGFPCGFSRALGLPNGSQSWFLVWAELTTRLIDDDKNVNNRFEMAGQLNAIAGGLLNGPFWGHPVGRVFEHLGPRSPGYPFAASGGVILERLRVTEQRLPGTQESWKLYGAGSVGGQCLVGIPHVHKLRRDPSLAHCSRVWPFETGFLDQPGSFEGHSIIHAEIWPGIVSQVVQGLQEQDRTLIKDRAQVRAMCNWAMDLDREQKLLEFFGQPPRLTSAQIEQCIEEEGWVLGAR